MITPATPAYHNLDQLVNDAYVNVWPFAARNEPPGPRTLALREYAIEVARLAYESGFQAGQQYVAADPGGQS